MNFRYIIFFLINKNLYDIIRAQRKEVYVSQSVTHKRNTVSKDTIMSYIKYHAQQTIRQILYHFVHLHITFMLILHNYIA